MKKVYAGISLCFAFLMFLHPGTASAQCTPDTTISSPGFSPNPLPNGCVGQAYSQVVSFLFPNDTTITVPPFGSMTIPFDSFVVVAVMNIPAGLNYACNVGSSCTYVTNPPNPTYGCVEVSGTPTTANSPTDSIQVVGQAWVTILGSPQPFNDTVNIGLLIENCGTGIFDGNQSDFDLAIAPNPVTASSTVDFTLENSQMVNVSVMDMLGRNVMDLGTTRRFAGKNQISIGNAAGLSPGIYSLKVSLENGTASASKKIVVVN